MDTLPAPQREALEQWLFEENITYKAARERLQSQFSVRCSPSAFQQFYQRTAQRRTLDRIKASAENANAVVKKLSENPADNYTALLGLIRQAAFDAAMGGERLDVETLSDLTSLVLSNRSLDLKAATVAQNERKLAQNDRRIALLEKKAEQADAARKVTENGALTPEQRDAEYRRIFGMS